jgi:hypothetical protein
MKDNKDLGFYYKYKPIFNSKAERFARFGIDLE